MKKIKKINFWILASISFFIATGVFFNCIAFGEIDSSLGEEIHLLKGDLERVKVFDLNRVSLTDPGVVDMVSIEGDHILLLGKQVGKTTLFIWDAYGKRSAIVRVLTEELSLIKSRVEALINKTEIKGIKLEIDELEGQVVASGEIPKEKNDQLEGFLKPFGNNIRNLVKVREEKGLVQIDAQIIEFTTSFTKQLGLEWTNALTYGETRPSGNIEDIGDLFEIGKFQRTTSLSAVMNMLISEGKGRILSQPKLVCVSGKSASFLVGGEIPISTTTTSSGGNVQQNVNFKSYGINLTVNPTIRSDRRIDVGMSISVSDIDASYVGSNTAFTTRNAKTNLYLDNGQTVVMAGLIKTTNSKTVTRIPGLSDIPIIGALFRSKTTISPTTELVITLTPTILEASNEAGISSSQSAPGISTFVPSTLAKASVPREIAPYARLLQQKIAERAIYPEQARQYQWEGTVKLSLRILSDGTLASASVVESSGYELFDNNALRAAQSLSPNVGFPADEAIEEITLTVPIAYAYNVP